MNKKNPKIIALVPMRHHSERIVGKNFVDFHGQPLFYWILQTLLSSKKIDSVFIDTNSDLIKEEAPKISSRINIIDRPSHLCSDLLSLNEILLHDVTQVKADFYLQTHSTNPLLKKTTIDLAIAKFLESDEADSLFGATKFQARFWDKRVNAINHDPKVLLRTQDLEPFFLENSNLYLFSKKSLEENRSRIGKKPILFEIPAIEAWDIDTEEDLKIAKVLFSLGGSK